MNFNLNDRTNIKMIGDMVANLSKLVLDVTEETMAKLDGLKAEVEAQRTVMAGAGVLLTGLATRIRKANDSDDADGIDAIVTEVREMGEALAAALVRNTAASGEVEGADTLAGSADTLAGAAFDHAASDGPGLTQPGPEPGITEAETVEPQGDAAGMPSAGGPGGPEPSPDPTAGDTGVDALAGSVEPAPHPADDAGPADEARGS